MKYKAPAKLNLFLHITKRRHDRYHELQTLFQPIDYCDEIDFVVRSDGKLDLDCNVDIPPQSNMALKAARLLQQRCNISQGADIRLHKRIAIGAGLGGGSSDAATTLRALNELWGCRLSNTQLIDYASILGADVPLFIVGRSAWGEGIGDLLQEVDLPPRWYAVFVPPYHIDTRTMYECPELQRDCPLVSMEDYLAGRTSNVFETVVRHRYPGIRADMDRLAAYCAVRLTGSGGAFFASCESEQQAAELAENHLVHLQSFIARSINPSESC